VDFIFMLTHHDKTVADCLEVYESIAKIGLEHVGFKDVGVDHKTLQKLTQAIKKSGAVSYVEVVSTSPESIRRSIEIAAELGVDRVLGGQDIDHAMESFADKGVSYYPFPGRPVGHPTKLGGSPSDVERDCARAMAAGCAGVDLLAFRATEADPLDLIRAARRGLEEDGYLIVAGSIDSKERMRAIEEAGADAFTIGSAIFENSFAPGVKGVPAQCKEVLRALGG
jgi:indole-3-glycerol phosphate synthase